MPFSQIEIGPRAYQIIEGDADNPQTILLINNDPNNTIYLGDDRGITVAQTGTGPLPPQSTIVFDGTADVWAVAAVNTMIWSFPGGLHFTQPLSSLTVGIPGGPQVIIKSAANITVSMLMPATNAAPTDITGFATLEQLVAFPSNSASETDPPIVAATAVTYASGQVVDGLLILGGNTTGGGGIINLLTASPFTLYLGQAADNTKQPVIIHGFYVYSTATNVQLMPSWVEMGSSGNVGSLGFYTAQDGPLTLQQTGTIVPPVENWTAFNPLSNLWAVAAGYTNAVVRLIASPRNCIEFDALLTVGTAADGTIVATLPAKYRPSQTKTFPVTVDVLRVIAAGPPTTTEGARFSLDSSGNLRCFGIAAAATQVSLTGCIIPLDNN